MAIRALVTKQIVYGDNPIKYHEYAGLHDDTKPTAEEATGSLFLEVDTGDMYAFDEAGSTWHKIAALGGSDS
jgi:hypothetical protein